MTTRTWRAGLARGWRLAAVAAVMLGVGLALLARGSAAGDGLQFEDLALDERASRTQASVAGVEAVAERDDWVRVRYEFGDLAGRQVQGSCWSRAGTTAVGDARTVEFLADQPAVNRLQEGRRTLADRPSTWPMGLLVLPSMLLLLLWLRGAARWVTEAA